MAPAPADMQQRWVEITGPTDRKMTINALNSGADGFMADFEDANAPTWHNMVDGHINLRDAIDGTITYDGSDGRHYELVDDPATLLVRPRGWHLPERHLLVGGEPVAGALFDFGLYFFHCAPRLLRNGLRPVLLPAEDGVASRGAAMERRLLLLAGRARDPRGTIKATVLIETLPAAFEMDEILYELRDHSAGLNAGRWDYIFSAIKCFPDRPEMVLPDRGDVTMTVPFMRAYAELLAATCHRRGAHAMGGMAALIPSRSGRGGEREGARRRPGGQAARGRAGLRRHLGRAPRSGPDRPRGVRARTGRCAQPARGSATKVEVTAKELLDLAATPGQITEAGLRTNVSVGFQYISFWLDRPRRRGDQLADGGRRHRGDLAHPDLAMDPP